MINSLSPVLLTQYGKYLCDGCRITFGLRPHVIQHPSIGIFAYCMNKQGITNSIQTRDIVNSRCLCHSEPYQHISSTKSFVLFSFLFCFVLFCFVLFLFCFLFLFLFLFCLFVCLCVCFFFITLVLSKWITLLTKTSISYYTNIG